MERDTAKDWSKGILLKLWAGQGEALVAESGKQSTGWQADCAFLSFAHGYQLTLRQGEEEGHCGEGRGATLRCWCSLASFAPQTFACPLTTSESTQAYDGDAGG